MGEKDSILLECHRTLESIESSLERISGSNDILDYELWGIGGLQKETDCLAVLQEPFTLANLLERLRKLDKESSVISGKLRENVNKL